MTTICIHLFHHFILITLLLLYKITIINFLEELAYVRRRRNKKLSLEDILLKLVAHGVIIYKNRQAL